MKFLAVCGFGVGSSMVLSMTIQKVCPILGIDAEVENTDISSSRGIVCDAIFTSAELAQEIQDTVDVPVYPIKKYMDINEVKNAVENFLKNIN